MKTSRSATAGFFGYQAPAPRDFDALPAGCFGGTREQWEQLTPGFRREIVRTHEKMAAAQARLSGHTSSPHQRQPGSHQ